MELNEVLSLGADRALLEFCDTLLRQSRFLLMR
jgi:hypothetical protein